MTSFDDVMNRARALGPKRLAVAGRVGSGLQEAVDTAAAEGLATAECFEDARLAVDAVRCGDADILMKGNVKTGPFMGAILDRETGLRSGKLMSHVAVLEAFGRLILMTDGGVCLNPTLDDKVEIIRNAVAVAAKLGIDTPRVAVLAATEVVNPKMPETVDADALSKMDLPGCVVQGPLAVDNAVCEEAARVKGLDGPVVGRADVLLVPSVLVGNIFAKGIMYFADCRFGGVLAGASRPVAMLSRSDTTQTHLHSIALGVLTSQE